MIDLFYLAKPRFGGWISFTAHLALKEKFNIFKITKRGEKKNRNFGYGTEYRNINIETFEFNNPVLITAIDKNYYEYLKYFPDNTIIVIHDPTEVKPKSSEILLQNLPRFKIYTIRKNVQTYLKNTFDLESKFKPHPFFPYIKNINNDVKDMVVSVSRIDFDKHIDILLFANEHLENKIQIYGSKNDLYVFHHLKNKLNMELDNYHGSFEKSFDELNKILGNAKYVVDMSSINNDGGGTQYTYLEAIYENAVLILNTNWITPTDCVFKDNFNCLTITTSEDLVDVLKKEIDLEKINCNAQKLLKYHLDVDWSTL